MKYVYVVYYGDELGERISAEILGIFSNIKAAKECRYGFPYQDQINISRIEIQDSFDDDNFGLKEFVYKNKFPFA